MKPNMLLYNPSQLSREDLERLFIVRSVELDELLSRIRAIRNSLQHSLLIGDRGMGKTTLLNRLAHRIEDDPELVGIWLPICFDEEQYSFGGLADLWLNCLDIAAEKTEDSDLLHLTDKLRGQYRGEKLEEEALRELKRLASAKKLKLLLLVDNFGTILNRLKDIESRRLRDTLISQTDPWLILIGASSNPIKAAFDYEGPFYELFRISELHPLSQEETSKLLRGLASIYGHEAQIEEFLERETKTFDTLCELIDGTPRIIAVLFTILQSLPGANLSTLLTHLLDYHTSDYKDRIEALSTQGQRVFDILAQLWNPATAEQVARTLRIDRGAASAQLHRLVDRGMVKKVKLPDGPMGFLVRQRLFNLWSLMRGERRNRHRLRSLLDFLSILHSRRKDQLRDFRRLMSILEFLDLLNPELSKKFQARVREIQTEDQQVLSQIRPPQENMALLLAYLSVDRYKQAELLSEDVMRLDPESLFTHLVRTYILQRLGRHSEAIQLLEGFLDHDWVRIEYARLLLMQGRTNDARRAVLPLVESSILPPEQLAQAALDLVGATGGDSIAWLAQDLLAKANASSPENFAVIMAQCRVELHLERTDKSIELLQVVLSLYRPSSSSKAGFEVLELILELARKDRSGRVLDILKENELGDNWPPLVYALEHLENPAHEILERLAPEMKSFTQQVLTRINSTG